MILYFDSLFAEGRERVVKPLHKIPDTLNRLYLMAMREHARDSVLRSRDQTRWVSTPDWRLDRQVIRIGLYLRDRLNVAPADRVAIVSELRSEWLVADLAITELGGVSVAIDPALDAKDLVGALTDAAPRVAFASSAVLEKLGDRWRETSAPERIITFDEPPARDGIERYASVLDLGGTLDTPERAQSIREQAREVGPEAPAICHYRRGADGSHAGEELTQAEAIERVATHWLEQPPAQGDVAYVVGPEVTLSMRLALYAFVGDGYTVVALGHPGSEVDEIADLRPDKIIAPPSVLEGAVLRQPSQDRARGLARWIPWGRSRRDRDAVREALGGRARWIAPTAELDATVAQRLRNIVAVDDGGESRRAVASQ
ncbi:MAG: AMP-binding protein [Gemmatimonadales bacterium]|nr:AMP-binding protein [Gemmatimonadales bacterium]